MSDAFERAVSKQTRRRRSRAAAAFRMHAFWYVVVNLLLVGIWFFSSQPWGADEPWFAWSLFGWGIGLAAHWWTVRNRSDLT